MLRGRVTPYDLVTLLARKVGSHGQLYVYSGHTHTGALLVRVGLHQRVMVKPWNRTAPVGTSKLRETMASFRSYKGHPVDKWIFVAREFRQSAVRFAESGAECALIQVDEDANDINVLSSKNVPEQFLLELLSVLKSKSVPVAYDFDGILRQKGSSTGDREVETVSRAPHVPKAFISYSYDSSEHRHWVIRLSAELIRNGVAVLIDEWDLKG